MVPAQQTRLRASQRQPKVEVTTPPMDMSNTNDAITNNTPPQKRRRRPSGTPKATKKAPVAASPDQAAPPPLPTPSPENEPPPDMSDKKARLRLRNREAAQKCRKRKQRGINDLQNQEAAAGTLHEALAAEASQLRGEVLMLKSMVLQHGGCGCSFIEDYIRGQASSLAQGGAETLLSNRGDFFGAEPQPGDPGGGAPEEMDYTYGGLLGLDEADPGAMMPDIKAEMSPLSRDSRRLPSMTPFVLDVDRSIDLHA